MKRWLRFGIFALAPLMVPCLRGHEGGTHKNITTFAVAYLRRQAQQYECATNLNSILQEGAEKEDPPGDRVYLELCGLPGGCYPRFGFHFSPRLSFFTPVPPVYASASCDSVQWGLSRTECRLSVSVGLPICPLQSVLSYDKTKKNNHSWLDARDAVGKPETREMGWRHLGYVLHLLEDLTSPAHSRNDLHLRFVRTVPETGPDLEFGADLLEAQVRAPESMPPNGLIDFTSPQEAFIRLQALVEANFFSKDTVFHASLMGPSAVDETPEYYQGVCLQPTADFPVDNSASCHNGRRKIAYKGARYWACWLESWPFTGACRQSATIDDTIARGQFTELGPVAVLYTASLIQRFYREAEQPLMPGCTAEVSARSWGGSGDDSIREVATDSQGNIYLTGASRSYGAGGSDVLLLKYDPAGNLLWSKTWGGGQEDFATAVAVDGVGNVYVAGATNSFGAGWYDALLLKFDSLGNPIWAKTWGGGSYEVAYGVALDAAGNPYVAAETYTFGAAAALLKFSSSGDLLATRTWKSPASFDAAYSLDIDGNGNVVLAGISWAYGGGGLHNSVLLVKYDSQLNPVWGRNWTSPDQDEATGSRVIRTDGAGNVLVAGRKASGCYGSDFSACDFDIVLLRFDPQGNPVWSKRWGGTGSDVATGLAFDRSGNLVVTGRTRSFLSSTSSALLLTYDPKGTLLSSRIWGGNGVVEGSSVTVDPSNNVFVAGLAPNNTGRWTDVTGLVSVASGSMVSPSTSLGSPSGSVGSPVGVTTTPNGVKDAGGGASDALVARYPAPW